MVSFGVVWPPGMEYSAAEWSRGEWVSLVMVAVVVAMVVPRWCRAGGFLSFCVRAPAPDQDLRNWPARPAVS